MDLWVVAAAAGAGYLAKYWQNLSGENGLSDGNSIRRQSKSQYLLQQMQDQNTPFCESVRKGLGGDVSLGGEHDESVSDWTFHELDRHGGSLAAGNASTSDSDAKVLANVGNYENYNVLMTKNFPPEFQGKENFQDNVIGIGEKNESFDNFGDALLGFETYRLAKSKPLRSRSREFSVKPLNPLESYLTAQLYREQAQKDEFEFSLVPSPLTPTVRPLLVTDGNRNN